MALVYFIAGKISFLVHSENEIVTIVLFAAEGFALAGAIIFGKRIIPGIFLGQFILGLSTGLEFVPSFFVSIINSIEALLAIFLFNKLKLDKSLPRMKDILGLTLLIVFILQPFSAIFSNTILYVSSVITSEQYPKSLFTWWFGNSMGQLLIAPFLLYLYNNYKNTNKIEFLSVGAFFFALAYFLIIFIKLDYLALLISVTMPLLIFLIIKRGLHYATFGILAIAFIAIYSVHENVGLFSTSHEIENIINLNFYILSHILLSFFIGALFNEKKEAMSKMETMALYDSLTGLANRNLLDDRIEYAIKLSKRYTHQNVVCFIDIDKFKNINDTLGHEAGDIVLQTIANRISSLIRDEDSLLRIGGDEFVLILMNNKNKKNIENKLNQILDLARNPISNNDFQVSTSLSIGASLCPSDSNDAKMLVKYADIAMYEAKAKGSDCFVFYNEKE